MEEVECATQQRQGPGQWGQQRNLLRLYEHREGGLPH